MEDNWFQKTAEEAELVLSDEDDSDDEKVRVFSQRRVFKNWVGPALVFLVGSRIFRHALPNIA